MPVKYSTAIVINSQRSNFSRLSLRTNLSWNLVGNLIYAVCQWGMLIVLAKMTTPEMVGRFSMALAVTAPIILMSQLQLREILATDAKGEFLFEHYLSMRMVSTLIALMLILVFVLWGGYTWEASVVILAMGLSKAVESISDIYYGLMQRNERMDLIAKSRIIKGTFSLVAMGAAIYVTGDVLWGVLSLAVIWASILVFYDLPSAISVLKQRDSGIRASLMPPLDSYRILKLMHLALPLGVVGGLISLKPNIPRYFIEYYLGEWHLGIYAALAYLTVVGHTFVSAVGQSVTPKLANYFAAGNFVSFRKLLLRLTLVGILIGFFGVTAAFVAGRPLLLLLYGLEYAEQSRVFILLMFAGAVAFVASFICCGIMAARNFKIQMPLFLLATGTTGVLAWVLIPHYGAVGAALSLTAGSMVLVAGGTTVLYYIAKASSDRLYSKLNDI